MFLEFPLRGVVPIEVRSINRKDKKEIDIELKNRPKKGILMNKTFTKIDKKILLGSLVTGVLATGFLYSTEPEEKAHAQEDLNTHTVLKGDNLWRISLNNHVSLEDLMAQNGLTSDLIHPGDKLSIPSKKEPVPEEKSVLAYGNELTDAQYQTLLMVVQQESGGRDYDATLAVMSVITNRVDVSWYQDSVWEVVTAKGQFEAYGAGHYLRHEGKITDTTRQAVADALSGKKNVDVLNFWSDWYYYQQGRYDEEAVNIGGNIFFNL